MERAVDYKILFILKKKSSPKIHTIPYFLGSRITEETVILKISGKGRALKASSDTRGTFGISSSVASLCGCSEGNEVDGKKIRP